MLALCALLLTPAPGLPLTPPARMTLRFEDPAGRDLDLLIERLAGVEARLQTVEGVAALEVEAWPGSVRFSIRLQPGTAPAVAAQRLRAALTAVTLPDDLAPPALTGPEDPVWRRAAVPADAPGARARIEGLAARLARFAGVTRIETCGLEDRRELLLDPQALAARGLPLNRIIAALEPGPPLPDLGALRLSPTLRLGDVSKLSSTATCRCQVAGAAAYCLTIQGRGGAPLRLDEALGDATRLPDGWRTVTAHLSGPAAGDRALTALGPLPHWSQRRDHSLQISAAPEQIDALAATLAATPGVALAPPLRPSEPAWILWLIGPEPLRSQLAQRLQAQLATLAAVRQITRSPALERQLTRARLSPAGVQAGLTDQTLNELLTLSTTGRAAGSLWLRLAAPESLETLPVPLPGGQVQPLSALAQLSVEPGPALRLRRDGAPASRLWIRGGDGPTLRAALARQPLPPGVTVALEPEP